MFVYLFGVLLLLLLLTFLLYDSKISILVQIRAQEIKLLLLFTLQQREEELEITWFQRDQFRNYIKKSQQGNISKCKFSIE